MNPSGGNKLSNVRSFLSFSDRKRALSPSTEISVLTFVLKKKKVQWSFPGSLFFECIGEATSTVNAVLVV